MLLYRSMTMGLQVHDISEVISQMYNVLVAGETDLNSNEMIHLLTTTIECNPKFSSALGDNCQIPAQWQGGGGRQKLVCSGRNYVRERVHINQYYFTNNAGSVYCRRDQGSYRYKAPLLRKRYTYGQQQQPQSCYQQHFQHGSQSAFSPHAASWFGARCSIYHSWTEQSLWWTNCRR